MSNERTKNTKLHTRRKRSLSLQLEQLETRAMLAASPCHNETQPADINADGFVSPIDALSVINLLNAEHTHCGVANGQFADVNNDSIVSPIDVLLVVNTLSLQAEGEGNALISLRLQVENFDRTPLQNIAVGEEFFLSVYVQDVSGREPADSGVYAAYLDIDFDANLASVVGPITYGEDYENGQRGTVSPGLIDEAGAFDGGQPLGIEETLLLSVPMVSDGNGNLEFSASSADILPAHDSLLFGFDDAIPLDQIMYGSVALNVGGVPPVANDDSYQAFFGDVLTVETQRGVLANDTDPNGEDLVAELVVGPDLGELTLNKDGSFVYTPFSGVIGTDTFSYQAVTG
ncbi:MAG: cadherin-like domain-containing protein, partial [Planctomycetales bacterium]|nr:cadherin-like domain-containing protein [Planctomycetales bacterium]